MTEYMTGSTTQKNSDTFKHSYKNSSMGGLLRKQFNLCQIYLIIIRDWLFYINSSLNLIEGIQIGKKSYNFICQEQLSSPSLSIYYTHPWILKFDTRDLKLFSPGAAVKDDKRTRFCFALRTMRCAILNENPQY